MKTWKVAIIGCGNFTGGQYLPDIHKIRGAELVAVCDIIPERAQAYAARAGISQWYTSIDELLEKCDFDILMDATSIPAHHEINMKAILAGKHLFSKKPAGLTVEAVTEQIEAAKKMGVTINAAPVHAMRYSNRVAKQLIADGVIGKPNTVRCHVAHGGPEYFQYRDVNPEWFYAKDSGALFDMGVHALHYATDMLGPARQISCMAACSRPTRMVRTGDFDGTMLKTDNLPDNYAITLHFGDGRIGEVYTGYCQLATRMPTMEIYGDKGTIAFVKDPGEIRPHLEVFTDHPDWGIRGWTRPEQPLKETPFCDTMCLQDLIDAIEAQRSPVLSMERQRHLVEMMCAIPRCIETGETVHLTTTFEEA